MCTLLSTLPSPPPSQVFNLLGLHEFLPTREAAAALFGQICRQTPLACASIITAVAGLNTGGCIEGGSMGCLGGEVQGGPPSSLRWRGSTRVGAVVGGGVGWGAWAGRAGARRAAEGSGRALPSGAAADDPPAPLPLTPCVGASHAPTHPHAPPIPPLAANMNLTRLQLVAQFAPSGTSVRNIVHWAQAIRKSREREAPLFQVQGGRAGGRAGGRGLRAGVC